MQPPIVVQGVYKSYPSQQGWKQLFSQDHATTALIDISFSIESGECFGVVGLNGAGKTTLLKLISSVLLPDRGRITVMGHETERDAAAVRQCVGVCSANDRSFYGRLSVFQNLVFFGRLYYIAERRLRERIGSLCETLGLADYIDASAMSLSTGMRQRLALVRALLNDPPVVILDEPTKALDPISAIRLRTFVKSCLIDREHKTVILATNQLEEASNLCDRTAILREHRVAALGTSIRVAPVDLEYMSQR
jgi:ABC-2 type transport system ATP-binding protein